MTIRRTEFAFAMRRAGLKQKTLAALTGRDRSTVGRWMHGELPVPEYAWTIVRLTQRIQQLEAAPNPKEFRNVSSR